MGIKAIESNILAAMEIASKIKTTYGPKGRDKMLVLKDGTILISNDGATILKHLKSSHPIAQMLVDLSKTQDELVGDGTTSIVLFTSFLLKEALDMIRMDIKIDDIIEGFEVTFAKLMLDGSGNRHQSTSSNFNRERCMLVDHEEVIVCSFSFKVVVPRSRFLL